MTAWRRSDRQWQGTRALDAQAFVASLFAAEDFNMSGSNPECLSDKPPQRQITLALDRRRFPPHAVILTARIGFDERIFGRTRLHPHPQFQIVAVPAIPTHWRVTSC